MTAFENTISSRSVTLRLYTQFKEREVNVRVVVVGEAHIADGAIVELKLVRENTGDVLQCRKIENLLQHSGEVSFPLSDLESGCCSFQAVLKDQYGTKLPVRVLQDKFPGNYAWLGGRDGISRKVPPPWSPLKSRRTSGGISVECWERKYEFDREHFIKQILSSGRPLLAGPMRLIATTHGRTIRWRKTAFRLISKDADQVVFTRNLCSKDLLLCSHTELEFDGMVRIDWALSSKKPIRLDALVMEITIPAEYAKYFYCFPGSWESAENVGSLPVNGVTMGFRPFIWIGDEERGLAWFAESDKNWFKQDPRRVIEIMRNGKDVILRLHIVSSPINLMPDEKHKSGLTGFGQEAALFAKSRAVRTLGYTFGFQATPVKPVEKDAWDYRVYTIGQRATGSRSRLNVPVSLLDNLVKSGVRTVVIFEHWTDAEGYTKTPHAKQLKKIIHDCHSRGLQVLLYFSFLISDRIPEWRDFGKDCVVMPKGGYPVYHYLPQPDQSAWRVCLRSPWQDFLAEGIGKAMRNYDIDGVYLDGTEYPFGCCNTEHGCGALWPDGSITPTYPIFSVRSAMQRIYKIVRSCKPEGQILIHNSTCMTIPTLEWGTTYWDGEQFANIVRNADVSHVLPLDGFRAEFMGHQWGVPAELMWYGIYRQAWAFALLHDVPVRAIKLEYLKLKTALWKVMDDFGRKNSQWLPYWRNSAYISALPCSVFVSLYWHPANGVLAVVSNLEHKNTTADIRFNLLRLNLAGKNLIAIDALENISLPMQKGRLRLKLSAWDFKLIWIKCS